MPTDEQVQTLETGVSVLQALALDSWGVPGTASIDDITARVAEDERTVERALGTFADRGFLDRDDDGVRLTGDGRRYLWEEYRLYCRLFSDWDGLTLEGTVTSGLGKGRHFVSLPGYQEQFVEKLGYEPFPGTLNLDLTAPSTRARIGLESVDPIRIDEWSDEDQTYGAAVCYPVILGAAGAVVEPAHLIVPVRTDHDADEIELLAPVEVRAALDLEDGDHVTVDVIDHQS